MRIVHLTQSTTTEVTGGLEHHVDYLTAAQRRLGHEVIVVNTTALAATVPPGAEATSVRRQEFLWLPRFLRHPLESFLETVTMFGRRLFRRRHAAQVARHVDGLRPDVVHQHAYVGELRACWLISRKYPLVFTNHTGAYLHLDRWLPTRLLQRRLMKRFDMVIGPSRELLPATENSRYVPNGVDTTVFFPRPDRERLKTKHGYAGKLVFLCPRRWAPTKGVVYLVRALRHLSDAARRGSVFLFAGNETPGYARYQQNVLQELDLANVDVRVLGNLDHTRLAELMNLSDACIIPSLMEATSLACLEAMACATPVIGTRTGGLLELIREDENGWLVPARDAQALAGRIDAVFAADRADLERVRQAGLDMVREHYTWAATARKTQEIYQTANLRWRRRRNTLGGAAPDGPPQDRICL